MALPAGSVHDSTAIYVTQAEFLTGSLIMGYTGEQAPEAATTFYHRTGFSDAQLDNYQELAAVLAVCYAAPHNYQRLSDDKLCLSGAGMAV